MAEACEEAGFLSTGITIGLVVGVLLVGILIGYIIGRRKALLAALKKAGEKMRNQAMKQELKKMMDSKGAGEEEQEEEDEDEKAKEEAKQLLEEFLNRATAPGLDDHPSAFVNPILMLQIKKKKEDIRREKMYEKLLAAQNFEEGYIEGLNPEERTKLAESLLEQEGGKVSGGVGSVEGVVRRWGATVNSTRILVDAGASFVPGQDKQLDDASVEEKLSIEVRDKMKQIDTHLNKHYDVDVTREDRIKQQNKRSGDGKRLKDALTVANETKNIPFQAAHEVLTFDERRDFAQRGRARVGPPQDHANEKGGGKVRRASAAGNALALEQAMQDAKAQEMRDKEALTTLQGGGDGMTPPPSPPVSPPATFPYGEYRTHRRVLRMMSEFGGLSGTSSSDDSDESSPRAYRDALDSL